LSSQAFIEVSTPFTKKAANLGGWGSSEYLSIVGLKDVLILHSTLVSFLRVIKLLIAEHCFALKCYMSV